jgi:hypothetical protein
MIAPVIGSIRFTSTLSGRPVKSTCISVIAEVGAVGVGAIVGNGVGAGVPVMGGGVGSDVTIIGNGVGAGVPAVGRGVGVGVAIVGKRVGAGVPAVGGGVGVGGGVVSLVME